MSPLVAGGLLVVHTGGHDGGALIAFDPATIVTPLRVGDRVLVSSLDKGTMAIELTRSGANGRPALPGTRRRCRCT
jgi:hypothetical protein